MVAKASKHLSGGDIMRFLQSFEGAAASFGAQEERWTLWLPEMTLGERPLTPASQVFFPVIMRHGQQAIAIRFVYDCSVGKVRYYTSAIPVEIASRPEFENAVSELFRHSLPVEPMRERKLSRDLAGRYRNAAPPSLRPQARISLADPEPASSALAPAPQPPAVEPAAPVMQIPAVPAPAVPERRSVRIEIGPRIRSVLVFLIFSIALVALGSVGVYAYLKATQDPGLQHHRMELEQQRWLQRR